MTRDEAIHYAKCLKNNWTLNLNDLGEFCDMAIEALEQKRGEWIAHQDGKYHCSRCNDVAPKGYRWDYCPNCGAYMRERREDDTQD